MRRSWDHCRVPLMETNRTTFIICLIVGPKMKSNKGGNYDDQFMKTVKEIPSAIGQPLVETKCSARFNHFHAKYFSLFQNCPSTVLDTLPSPWAHTLQKYYYTPDKGTKNTYSQNKFATPEKSQK